MGDFSFGSFQKLLVKSDAGTSQICLWLHQLLTLLLERFQDIPLTWLSQAAVMVLQYAFLPLPLSEYAHRVDISIPGHVFPGRAACALTLTAITPGPSLPF